MRYLVVGLGSMGKRRVRNLFALGNEAPAIAGFDPRGDRREEVSQRYGVITYDDFDLAIGSFRPDALIISTPPQQHMAYASKGSELELHCFIEASVVEAAKVLELAERVEKSPLVIVPSCTMRYFPGPRRVKELVNLGVVGTPLNANYHVGQYLPDWHPWEDIADYYVSQRETGGCRELVPFELTWLNDIFGSPQLVSCARAKLTDMQADIDDVYHCLLIYPKKLLLNLTVDVISRPRATRELRILGDTGQIVFSADENCVRHLPLGGSDWERYNLSAGTVEVDYINPEEPYIAEIRDFIAAIERGDRSVFPNSLMDDYAILNLLDQMDNMSGHSL